jgi:hypothetical protein
MGVGVTSEPIFTYESQGEKLMFIEQYRNKDTHRDNVNFKPRIVYDSMEVTSPYYVTENAGEYIKKEDLIQSAALKPT